MPDNEFAACPHCSSTTVPAAEFCAACGLALPSATVTGPRVISGRAGAQTAAGMKLRADELLTTAKRAARSLLSVGVINLLFAGLNTYLMQQSPRLQHTPYFVGLTISQATGGAIYVGLYFLANGFPLTATIVGLVVYLLKWGVDVGLNMKFHAGRANTGATANYQLVRLFMIVYLLRGIGAAVKHRRLEQQSAGSGPLPVIAASE